MIHQYLRSTGRVINSRDVVHKGRQGFHCIRTNVVELGYKLFGSLQHVCQYGCTYAQRVAAYLVTNRRSGKWQRFICQEVSVICCRQL